jgi:pyruvate,water dikinase
MVRRVIEGARRNGRHSGICGQAPSDYPEFAEFVVEAGIDSISLNPDSVLKTTLRLSQGEAIGELGTRSPRDNRPTASVSHEGR